MFRPGAVNCSNVPSHRIAISRPSPHISTEACNPPQQAGRSGLPKIAQRKSSISCTQGTPAGLPSGMPGIGLEMEGAVQHAPQLGRQFMAMGKGRKLRILPLRSIVERGVAFRPIIGGQPAPGAHKK